MSEGKQEARELTLEDLHKLRNEAIIQASSGKPCWWERVKVYDIVIDLWIAQPQGKAQPDSGEMGPYKHKRKEWECSQSDCGETHHAKECEPDCLACAFQRGQQAGLEKAIKIADVERKRWDSFNDGSVAAHNIRTEIRRSLASAEPPQPHDADALQYSQRQMDEAMTEAHEAGYRQAKATEPPQVEAEKEGKKK